MYPLPSIPYFQYARGKCHPCILYCVFDLDDFLLLKLPQMRATSLPTSLVYQYGVRVKETWDFAPMSLDVEDTESYG